MKIFLLWIFLFSSLSSVAQNTVIMKQDSLLNTRTNTGYHTLANNNTQNQDGTIDNIINYVNPVGNNFVFSVNSKKQIRLTVEIYSILGQRSMIKQFYPGKELSKFTMDVSSLSRGMYIVRFTDKSHQINLTRKLLKE